MHGEMARNARPRSAEAHAKEADPRLSSLRALALKARRFLEPYWADWDQTAGARAGDETLSAGTCGRSSAFLCLLLRRAGFDAEVAFGSPVECGCGFFDGTGWKGHGWVVVSDPPCILDITADQFGAAPVTVTGIDDPRYRRGHDIAGPGWKAERQRVARALLRDWDARMAARRRAGSVSAD